jgi:hypothetical protein
MQNDKFKIKKNLKKFIHLQLKNTMKHIIHNDYYSKNKEIQIQAKISIIQEIQTIINQLY